MDEYLNHLILHLKSFGNVYFPTNRIREYGPEKVLEALEEKGFRCNIRYFTDALYEESEAIKTNPLKKRKPSRDAVITLIKGE